MACGQCHILSITAMLDQHTMLTGYETDFMPNKNTGNVLFFAPFVSSTMRIDPQWIDYNGHLNMAYYHVLFDRAVEEAFALVGLGHTYLDEHGASFFAAEAHILYKRELVLNTPVRVTVQLIDHDDKRLHFYMEMRHATEGWLAATSENLSLHVDMASRKVVPFPASIHTNLQIMKTSHGLMRRPEAVGRVISLKRNNHHAEPDMASGLTRH
jgi:acyl-CoA thioester hydrolase